MEAKVKPTLNVRIKKWFRNFGRQWQLQSMAIPGIVYMIIFSFIPIYGLVIAFKNYTVIDTIESAQWVGLEKL